MNSNDQSLPGGSTNAEPTAIGNPDKIPPRAHTHERLLERLANDRYNLDDARNPQDLRDRRTWNLAIEHVIGIVRTEAGLAELVENAPVMSGVVEFDLSDGGDA